MGTHASCGVAHQCRRGVILQCMSCSSCHGQQIGRLSNKSPFPGEGLIRQPDTCISATMSAIFIGFCGCVLLFISFCGCELLFSKTTLALKSPIHRFLRKGKYGATGKIGSPRSGVDPQSVDLQSVRRQIQNR